MAIHTVKSATFGTINVGNGSTSVVGDMGQELSSLPKALWSSIPKVRHGIIPVVPTGKGRFCRIRF